jgi:hypothetical protein
MVMFFVGSRRHVGLTMAVAVAVIVVVRMPMVVAVVMTMPVIMLVFVVVIVIMVMSVVVVVVMSSLVVLLGREHMSVWREHAVSSSGLEVRPPLQTAQWRGNGALL